MLFSNYFTDSNKTITVVLFKIFLIFTIYFNSFTSAYASTAMNGWSLSNPVAKGASTLYNGAKNVLINGKNVAKTSTALITPVAKDVAKVLGKGVAGVALSVAVKELLGAVDWVLDPANNQIVYTKPSATNSKYLYAISGTNHPSADAACKDYFKRYPQPNPDNKQNAFVTSLNSKLYCNIWNNYYKEYTKFDISVTQNPAYNPDKDEKKTLPLDVVANQVISNAESGDSNAQVATTAAAADIVNDAQNDSTKARPIVNQLEANAETKTEEQATGQSKPNTETGTTDLSLTFPVFCSWAPVVCEAAQTVISFPQTLTNWWDNSVNALSQAYEYAKTQVQAVRDYFKEEKPEKENTEIEIQEIPTDTNKINVSIGDNICPSMPVSIHIPFSTVETDISPVYLCDIANGMKAFFIALGFFTASMIVGRRN